MTLKSSIPCKMFENPSNAIKKRNLFILIFFFLAFFFSSFLKSLLWKSNIWNKFVILTCTLHWLYLDNWLIIWKVNLWKEKRVVLTLKSYYKSWALSIKLREFSAPPSLFSPEIAAFIWMSVAPDLLFTKGRLSWIICSINDFYLYISFSGLYAELVRVAKHLILKKKLLMIIKLKQKKNRKPIKHWHK